MAATLRSKSRPAARLLGAALGVATTAEAHFQLLYTPEAALKRIEKGFQFVTVSSDARLIAAGAQQVLAKMRAHAGDGSKPAGY